MKIIIFTETDGRVSIVTPVINTYPVREGITEDEALSRAMLTIPADAINPQVVDASVIPTDRSKRRAWKQNGATIEVDTAKVLQLKDEDAVKAIDGIDRLQFEHLFRLENRTRALEGKLAITKAQYRDALIAEWKTLNP